MNGSSDPLVSDPMHSSARDEVDPSLSSLRWAPLAPLERGIRWCVGLLACTLAALVVATVLNVVILLRPVTVANVVEVAAPREASLYGYCYAVRDSYEVNVVAIAGGIEMTAAEGLYEEGAASSVALEISDWFANGEPLSFDTASEECAHLDGWE